MKGESLLRRRAGDEWSRHHSLWRLALANIIDFVRLLRNTWAPLAAFLVIMFGAATYLEFTHSPHLTPLAAIYDSLQLMVFQSSLSLPGDALGEALFFAAPLIGVLVVVQSVITFGRGFLDKRSRMQDWQVSLALTYRDHVVVSGLGRIGVRVITRLLQAGHEPVVIESRWDSPMVREALRMKVPVIVGDARDPQALRQARVGAARAVIASIDGDMVDIEIALVAREINPRIRVILRAFSEELDADLEQTFGPGSAFSTSGLAATTFTAAIISRGLDYVLPYGPGSQMLGITEIQIANGSSLIGTVSMLEGVYAARVLGIRGANGRRVRRAEARAGDTITLIGSLNALEAVRAASHSPASPTAPSHTLLPLGSDSTVIVCGLGKVGFRVVRRLHALERPPRIIVLDLKNDHEHFVKRVQAMQGVTLIQGDATDADLLKQVGAGSAVAVAALTSQDDVNLRICLAARSAQPGVHVVLRVFSHTLAGELAQLFGIHTAYSTSNLASPTLAMAGLLRGVRRAFYAGDAPYVSFDWEVVAGDRFAGATGAQVRDRYGALVVARWRAGVVAPLPPLAEPLAAGDKITVVGLAGDFVGLLNTRQ